MTPVPPSAAPLVVSLGGSNESFTSSRSERLGAAVLVLLVAMLAVVMFKTSNNAVDNMRIISDSGSTTYNMAITQRESLVFAVAFEQWLNGDIPRRELQIRRALLAQRLAVRDNLGVTNGSRVRSEYFDALGILDKFAERALPGLLSSYDQTILQSESAGALEQFAFESRELSVRISESSDRQTRQLIRDENSNRTNQYIIVLMILILMTIVLGFLEVSRRHNHHMVRLRARNERRELEGIRATLKQVDDELQSRLDQERITRAENSWLDSAVRSISPQFKSTLVSEQIAEFLAEGLGQKLGVDCVICYSFEEPLWPGFVKQWNRGTDARADESLIVKHESKLSDLINRLWRLNRVIIVPDSHLIDVSHDPIPELVATSREFARSWVIAPVADGLRVLGYVFVAMAEDARVWSPVEVALIQQVCSDAASACVHARMFNQSMKIAEHNAEVERLVELGKVKNNFIENMNHELRTPLTSIIGYLEVIMNDVDAGSDPSLASSLTAVQRNAIRLQILIENMMQISKTDFEHMPLIVSTSDVGHLLADVVNSLHLGAEDCGVEITLRLDSPAGDLLIDGDINQLEQVFVNLMSNAIKFTPRGGTVTVVARRVHVGDDYVEVKVIDTGIGIPRKEFANVFKRFFRASTATEASIPGFGIGLSLVHSIVREHHGTITFDSVVGKGTVFTVTLPARYISTRTADGVT